MKQAIESLINSITMYRLVLYGLLFIVGLSLMLSAGGIVQLSSIGLLVSLLTLIGTTYLATRFFAWIFSARYNRESWLITALIIFFLLLPVRNGKEFLAAVLVATIAVASKYILVFRGRHIFNPAAVALVISGLLGIAHAGWWVATPFLLPAVGVIGFLVAWKVRHFAMVATYIAIATLTAIVVALVNGYAINEELSFLFLSSPIVFAACIMLTEPLTAPSTRKWRLIYASLVGFLTTSQIIPFMTPELAIVIGNVLVFIVAQKGALIFEFIEAREIAPRTVEIILRPVRKFRFVPGQYLELFLPHDKEDVRGARRIFSIASSPSHENIHLGLTVSSPGSSLKKVLTNVKKGEYIRATRVGGDFVLPKNRNEPLLLIAGGIGITPFRAMLDDLIVRSEKRDIILMHSVRNEEAFVYTDVINQAKAALNVVYVPVVSEASSSWLGEAGIISFDTISRNVKDLMKRRIYLSGPSLMVTSINKQLIKGGVRRNRIIKDYFTGY